MARLSTTPTPFFLLFFLGFFLPEPIDAGVPGSVNRPDRIKTLVPSDVVGRPIFCGNSAPGLVFEGYTFVKKQAGLGFDCTVFLRCLDRIDDDVPISLRLNNLQEKVDFPVYKKTSAWSIGEVVTQTATYEGKVQGLFNLELVIGKEVVLLRQLSFFNISTLPKDLKDWTFYSSDGQCSLVDALNRTLKVSFYPPDVIGFALEEEARAGVKAGVINRKEIKADTNYVVRLELFDGYGSATYPGRLEQRVYLNDRLAYRHDLSGDRVSGWYSVELPIPRSKDTQPLEVRVELVSLVNLEPWGWGGFSKTLIRNVEILALSR